MTTVRKGQAPAPLARNEFHLRFMQSFYDPACQAESEALARLEDIAFDAYQQGRKAPRTRKAGPGFADPDCNLSIEWRATRDKLLARNSSGKNRTRRRGCCWCAARPATTAPAPARSPRPCVRRATGWRTSPKARLDRFIGYYQPHASSHETLDADKAVQPEVCNVALAVADAVSQLRSNTLSHPGAELKAPRPK